jgi:hypothetical protein
MAVPILRRSPRERGRVTRSLVCALISGDKPADPSGDDDQAMMMTFGFVFIS